MNDLILNLRKLHTTDLGAKRIRRNLRLDDQDVVGWCRQKIEDAGSCAVKMGKNWYIDAPDCWITVNASSYTIITAHKQNSATLLEKIAPLFSGWDEALIWSCLQGCMGRAIADHKKDPAAAMLDIGDFCFFAGAPTSVLFEKITGGKLLIPRDAAWEQLIENYYGRRAVKALRYAIKKEPDVFEIEKLKTYVDALDTRYEIKLFDREIFEMAKREEWSADLCSQFRSYEDYNARAIGAAVLYDGRLVSGASPYAVYHGGIEIEIDTKPECRKKGLATACGAKLILECLERGIYPSWDAHDLRSVALAQKLGYHLDKAYVTYEIAEPE